MERKWSRLPVLVASAVCAVLLLLPAVVMADPAVRAPSGAGRASWVGSWSVAVTQPATSGPSAAGFTDTTIRQVAHLSVGGDSLRLHISNAYGETPLEVGRVTVAARDDDSPAPPTWTR